MDEDYGWGLWMRIVGGAYGRRLWVGLMDEDCGWGLWIRIMNEAYGCRLWVGLMGEDYGWSGFFRRKRLFNWISADDMINYLFCCCVRYQNYV